MGGREKLTRYFFVLLLLWVAANFLQAWFTELNNDEAYYWMYSRHLAWGYFDHPPMIALMVKIGYSIFHNEAGVRLLTVLAQPAALLLLWLSVGQTEPSRKNIRLFFGIAASIVMFQVYGFVAVPDSPLLFFAALLLYSYQRFLAKASWLNVLLLSLSMAGMIYSKYQSGVLILLLILSNLRLLLNVKFWTAGVLALLLCVPHFYWQFENEFPSLTYHAVSRSKPFKLGYFLEYIPNQLAVFNPVVFGLTAYILLKHRAKDLFERALYFIIIGFILFFWLITFRGHAEPHWTIIAALPMIILIYRHSMQNQKLRRFVTRMAIVSFVLLSAVRIILAAGFAPAKTGFSGQEKWTASLKKATGDLPVVFTNSYQNASVYAFYTGIKTADLNDVYYRKTQFDIWNDQLGMHGKPAAILPGGEDAKSTIVNVEGKGDWRVHTTLSLLSVQTAKVEFRLSEPLLKNGKVSNVSISIYNPNHQALESSGEFAVSTHVLIQQKDRLWSLPLVSASVLDVPPHLEQKLDCQFFVDAIPPGEYKLMIGLRCGPFKEAYNSKPIKVSVR